MRLSYAIELIIALAAGMALERATTHFHWDVLHDLATSPRWVRYGIYLSEYGDPFCTGVVLVEGAAVWIEAGRQRSPRVWGFGRLSWSVSFCVVVMASVKLLIWTAGRLWDTVPPDVGSILGFWRNWWFTGSPEGYAVTTSVPPCLVGLLITSLAAKWPGDPSPDAREWMGRIFFVASMILYLIHETLRWFWG
jgi:hypothetical protein